MAGSAIPENRVFGIEAVHLALDEEMHPWHRGEDHAIDAHWARERTERPWLYNGTVMLHRGLALEDGLVTGYSHRAPFAALLHWVKTQPEADVWHLFGSAVLVSGDGALVLIRMGARTANAGKVYAPAGSLDESDIAGGRIDVEASMLREAAEETGLDLSGVSAEKRLWCWRQGGRVAVFRRFRLDAPAAAVAEDIRAHIRSESDPEIDDAVIIRAPAEAGPTVPPYMAAMIDFHFTTPDFDSGWQAGGNR